MTNLNLTILVISIMLNDSQSYQLQSNKFSNCRAVIISSKLPKNMGRIKLIHARTDSDVVNLIFTKETYIDMIILVKHVIKEYCNRLEARHFLNNGTFYQVIMLDSIKKVNSLEVTSLDKRSN